MNDPQAFKLGLFIGSWAGGGEVFASPWSQPTTSEGHWHFAPDPSGLHMIHDYSETRRDGTQFHGHGVLTHNPENQELLWFWFDSIGHPPLQPASGIWNDEELVLTKHTARGTGRTYFRFAHNRFDYFIETKLKDAVDFIPIMRGQFEKMRGSF